MSTKLSMVPLVCPLDGLTLENKGQNFACSRRHSFDVAAGGQINLMPVQFKASRDPGDSKSMVQARRRVMDTGLFEPVASAFSEIVRTQLQLKNSNKSLVVDVGCGEGYFTAQLSAHLANLGGEIEPVVFGVDVSKWAVAAAASRYKSIGWAVASGRSLPVRAGSPTLIMTLFGFQFWDSWCEIQKSGGLVLIVDAGPEHLIELREIIYPSLRVRDAPEHGEALTSGYEMIVKERVHFKKAVTDATILTDILEMTPHGHKTTIEARDSVKHLSELQLTFDTVIRVYKLS